MKHGTFIAMETKAFSLQQPEPIDIPIPSEDAPREQLFEFAALFAYASTVGAPLHDKVFQRLACAYLERWHPS
jgi:hypothetical protein